MVLEGEPQPIEDRRIRAGLTERLVGDLTVCGDGGLDAAAVALLRRALDLDEARLETLDFRNGTRRRIGRQRHGLDPDPGAVQEAARLGGGGRPAEDTDGQARGEQQRPAAAEAGPGGMARQRYPRSGAARP